MADSYLVAIKGILARLKAYTDLTDIVSQRIYTDVPDEETFPYCVLSATSADFSTKDDGNMIHTIQVNGYSTDDTPAEVGQIREAIYNALNRSEDSITLDSGTLVTLQFNGFADISKDASGEAWQAVIQFDMAID